MAHTQQPWLPTNLVLVALAFLSFTSALDYNLTLTSSSPTLSYFPSNASAGPTTAWAVAYTGSPPYSRNASLTLGTGSSVHYTNYTSGSVSFSFYGTSFAIIGRVDGTTRMTVDGKVIYTPPVAEDGTVSNGTSTRILPILGQATGMYLDYHNVSMVLTGGRGIEVHGVQLGLEVEGEGNTIANTSTRALSEFGGPGQQSLSDEWEWTGTWIPRSVPGSSNSNAVRAYPLYNQASATVHVPSNASVVLIYGTVEPDDVQYSVEPFSTAPPELERSIMPNRYPYATPFWVGDGVLLYVGQWTMGYAGNVSIYINNVGIVSGQIGIDRAVFLYAAQVDEPNAGRGLSKAAIGGIVAGVIIFALLILALAWFFYRKHRPAQRARPASTGRLDQGQYDDVGDISISPIDSSHSPGHDTAPSAPGLASSTARSRLSLRTQTQSRPHPHAHAPPAKSPFADPDTGEASTDSPAHSSPATPGAGAHSYAYAYASTSHLLASGRREEGGDSPGTLERRDGDTDSVRFGRKWEILQEMDGLRPGAGAGAGTRTGTGTGTGSGIGTGAGTAYDMNSIGREDERSAARGQRYRDPDLGLDLDLELDLDSAVERPREEDAGRVDNPEALPPGYDPAWRRD